jgi:hypothetical protein
MSVRGLKGAFFLASLAAGVMLLPAPALAQTPADSSSEIAINLGGRG